MVMMVVLGIESSRWVWRVVCPGGRNMLQMYGVVEYYHLYVLYSTVTTIKPTFPTHMPSNGCTIHSGPKTEDMTSQHAPGHGTFHPPSSIRSMMYMCMHSPDHPVCTYTYVCMVHTRTAKAKTVRRSGMGNASGPHLGDDFLLYSIILLMSTG